MRIRGAIAIAVLSSAACSNAAPPPAPERAAEVLVINIPRAPVHPRSSPGADALLDLDGIIERGAIRVLVARSGTHFFPRDGGHAGKTVDAGVALAGAISGRAGKVVQPVFVETHEPDLIPHLLAGKGDVAANLLLTFARDEQVAFAPPIRTGIRELIVTHESAPLRTLEDVGTRTIHVREGSDHHASLVRLNEQLRKSDRSPARIELTLPPMTDEQLLERVHQGHISATIVDDYVYERQRASLPHIVANPDIAVSLDGSLSWVTRKDAPRLIAVLKEFFTTHRLTF
ncbi:MAG TPA: transporter substrate-binding domain-containing protein [Vicinamibacterales bacterium]|nr:transporter substrate-binding domain-containing protein [Vicinamibacterales bacterium]